MEIRIPIQLVEGFRRKTFRRNWRTETRIPWIPLQIMVW